jgi:hypothetical protein
LEANEGDMVAASAIFEKHLHGELPEELTLFVALPRAGKPEPKCRQW